MDRKVTIGVGTYTGFPFVRVDLSHGVLFVHVTADDELTGDLYCEELSCRAIVDDYGCRSALADLMPGLFGQREVLPMQVAA